MSIILAKEGLKMYNTRDIACNIFPFWAAIILWLIYLLFRGEKPSKELVVSTRKEFYAKCYELEMQLGKKFKAVHEEQDAFKKQLQEEGKWIERVDYKESKPVLRGKVSKNDVKPHRNHILEGYKTFKESKKEKITKPISLIPETNTHYDIELFKNSKLEYKKLI